MPFNLSQMFRFKRARSVDFMSVKKTTDSNRNTSKNAKKTLLLDPSVSAHPNPTSITTKATTSSESKNYSSASVRPASRTRHSMADEWKGERGGSEAVVEDDGEDSLPVLTQYRIVLFSQHEGSVKVLREHQCLLQTVLLTAQQVRKRQKVLEHELALLLRLRPDQANMLHEKIGRSLMLRPAHEVRKSHELMLLKQRRQLRCLQLKMLQLAKVMLEERARAKARVDRLQRDYQREQAV